MKIIPGLPDDIAMHILALLPRAFYGELSRVRRSWRDALHPKGPVIALRKGLNIFETWIVFVSVKGKQFQFLLVDPAHRGYFAIVCPPPKGFRLPPDASVLYSSPMAAGSEVFIPATCYFVEMLWQNLDSERLYCFDMRSMEWKDSLSLFTSGHHPKCYIHYTSAAVDESLYVVGGKSAGSRHRKILKKAERFNIRTRTWEALPDMNKRRIHACAVVLQGRFCVVGGYTASLPLKVVDSGEIWDPNTRRWTLIPELWPDDVFGKQIHKPCIAVVKDTLYALRVDAQKNLQELMYYEDASKLWISMGQFCFPLLVESKYGFRLLEGHPCRMVGVADELFVFCCAEPLMGTKPQGALDFMVVLYIKPTLSRPLTWKIWPLIYPVDGEAKPLVLRV